MVHIFNVSSDDYISKKKKNNAQKLILYCGVSSTLSVPPTLAFVQKFGWNSFVAIIKITLK